MTSPKSRPFQIKVLTPLHIGCGQTYSGLQAVEEQGRLYFWEPEDVFEFINRNHKDQDFFHWLERQSNRIGALKQFFQNHRIQWRPFLQEARYWVPVSADLSRKPEINKFIHENHRPYIPGTEVKGALRTALLFHRLQMDPCFYGCLAKEIRQFPNKIDERRHETYQAKIDAVKNEKRPHGGTKRFLNQEMHRLTQRLEQRAFHAPDQKDPQKDARYDLLKYLFITDSKTRAAHDTLVAAAAIPFNMPSRNFIILSEYVRPEIAFDFTGIKLEAQPEQLNRLKFTETQQQYVSGYNIILDACHAFSAKLLEAEITYYQDHNELDVVNILKNLQSQNRPQNPLLRLGKDQGFLSTTVGLVIKESDPDLYKNVLIHTTEGVSYDRTDDVILPKTRKLVQYNNGKYPAGWVQLLIPKDGK